MVPNKFLKNKYIYMIFGSLIFGVFLGLLTVYIDALYLGLFTTFSYLTLMILGIPREKSSSVRKLFTAFCLIALPISWLAYFALKTLITV